ncbi:MAG TPA: aminotransferase class I/II-fold pyridoxal phosphate-dependent enzyme [Noviherbaspirillum sp.]|jgi:dTDP-4-amino-4,6-dideoxygalactose transaminase|uniref:aminotransferase class I/II-fold pyridoxal phosphate-dependent enzyme n=1 Tax=Noviherbaspirillum sp. TaxID=1926288 RepID=UPI002DDD2F99|nr:aminotransferase class I/II-fold pyridoxal phosphate-dependent enzyme [Noviherbaspirillum sp.]HEV2608919.1 aminotransferase class I/II-fold pyridoxal phosphate-dependent enzyme [Noviherbaspirillum sp.]
MLAFPNSLIPTQPVLSAASFFDRRKDKGIRSVLDAGQAQLVTSGRVAIALALQQMNIQKGDKVLVPAFHCSSMIEPVVWLGGKPTFYRINPDTSVNLDDIRSKIDGRTKVLMATNYFGFPQDLPKLRSFCDKHGIFLLEDCAHSFMGEIHGKPLGSYGDYAIASTMKFFPIYEGGCLVSSRHSIKHLPLKSAGFAFEMKAAFNTLEKGFAYGRMSFLKAALSIPMWLKDVVWGSIKKKRSSGTGTLAPGASDGGFSFEPAWVDKRTSFLSRYLVRTVSRNRMASKRRHHYLTLHKALSGLPGCRPLFNGLPDGVVPWVYPLYADNLQTVFPALKNAGVPIIRFGEYLWPDVDEKVCPASVELSGHLMQFPCHQDLRPDELEWMIGKISDVLQTNGVDAR